MRQEKKCIWCGGELSHGNQRICLECLLRGSVCDNSIKRNYSRKLLFNRGYDKGLIEYEARHLANKGFDPLKDEKEERFLLCFRNNNGKFEERSLDDAEYCIIDPDCNFSETISYLKKYYYGMAEGLEQAGILYKWNYMNHRWEDPNLEIEKLQHKIDLIKQSEQFAVKSIKEKKKNTVEE